MARCSTKPAILVLAGKHKIDGVVARKSLGMAKNMKSRKAPIQTVEAEMLRQPVVVVIFL